jgi:CRP-like cAMP-binding protein
VFNIEHLHLYKIEHLVLSKVPKMGRGNHATPALNQRNQHIGDQASCLEQKPRRSASKSSSTPLMAAATCRTTETIRRSSQGDPADAVFYILEGRVKLSIVSERGKEAVVALHGKGNFSGEGCLTGQPLRLATAATMTDCVITRLEKATIVRVLHDEPEFSEKFVAHLFARNACCHPRGATAPVAARLRHGHRLCPISD